MKLLMLVLAMAATLSQGYSVTMDQKSVAVIEQDDKKVIEFAELPEEVVEAFDQSVYKEWTVDKVFMIQTPDQVTYELHLTQLEETMVLLADSEGVLQPKADS